MERAKKQQRKVGGKEILKLLREMEKEVNTWDFEGFTEAQYKDLDKRMQGLIDAIRIQIQPRG